MQMIVMHIGYLVVFKAFEMTIRQKTLPTVAIGEILRTSCNVHYITWLMVQLILDLRLIMVM